MSETEKEEHRKTHASKETDYLRQRRTKLSVSDFQSLKIIGRGAFGEVFFYIILYLNLDTISSKNRHRTYLCNENFT